MARRSDFSYGLVWDLKIKYLKSLSRLAEEPINVKAENAFHVGTNTTTIIYKGTPTTGLIGKGYKYIQYLIVKESEHIDALELGKLFPENSRTNMVEKSSNFEVADSRTRKDLRNKILLLRAEREEAEKNDDISILELIDRDLEQLENYWREICKTDVKSKKVVKSKKFSNKDFKKRDSVKQAIIRAILKLKKSDRKTWEHFDKALKPIGLDYVRYLPDEKVDWDIK